MSAIYMKLFEFWFLSFVCGHLSVDFSGEGVEGGWDSAIPPIDSKYVAEDHKAEAESGVGSGGRSRESVTRATLQLSPFQQEEPQSSRPSPILIFLPSILLNWEDGCLYSTYFICFNSHNDSKTTTTTASRINHGIDPSRQLWINCSYPFSAC
jgi:hypothetical protein